MRILITLAVLLLTAVLKSDTLANAIEQTQATNHVLKGLTTNDIPAAWRTTLEEASTNSYSRKIFSRGNKKVLEVGWSKTWTGTRSNLFNATVYDGQTLVTRIEGLRGSTFVNPPKEATPYAVTTEIRKDGSVSVQVTDRREYFEVINVCGRGTHLLDDLEYTKTILSNKQMAHFWDSISTDWGKAHQKEERK